MCRSPQLRLVLDLGHQPHSDFFPTEAQTHDAALSYPLRLVSCGDCGLLQIDYFVNPSALYQQDYLYMSSTTATGRAHYSDMARAICDRFQVPQGSLVVDIGSNVGVLLQGFKEAGMKVLGVDPASTIAARAIADGIETLVDFFSAAVAERIQKQHGSARIITGTNVFAHLHELDDATNGMKSLLAEDGVIVIEAPHALPLIEHLEYDTIYHQHIGYLSVRPMRQYFERLGLELFDIEEMSIHGGTLRYFVGVPGKHALSPRINEMERKEEEFGLYEMDRLLRFAKDVEAQKHALVELVLGLKKEGKKIAVLSTPAKGNTLLNYCHLDRTMIDFATEKNPLKVGRYTPGTYIPILPDDALLANGADYALILAWNFAPEIMKNNQAFKDRGGRFIIPIPMPAVV
jgi:SAM-dependent methyltransferase